jgi:4-diphosphocytidyl-2-C-methyl-D-erythritol kinase
VSAGSAVTHWPAPAKLNLFLHITGRRADGYHLLQTVFQLVDLCDELEITPRTDGALERPLGLAGVAPDDDLVLRAARALRDAAGRPALGATIAVHKRIPAGAGMGGGSSDAASTLVALNRLWKLGLDLPDLAAIGLKIGADVPFFVHGSTAWAEGVGERLTPVETPERWFAVVHPGVAVATGPLFQSPDLTRDSPVLTIRSSLAALHAPVDSPDGVFGPGFRNDCEAVAATQYPAVREALAWLRRGGPARLTGTGACVFAPCASAAEATARLAGLPAGWRGFAVRTLDRTPWPA